MSLLKKFTALLMCIIFVLGVCGCAGGTTTSEYYTESVYYEVEEGNSSSSKNQGSAAESNLSEVTSGKTNVTKVEKKLFDKPVTFTVLASEHPYQTLSTKTVKFQELTAATNVTLDIDVVSSSNFGDKQTAVLASGKLYDINIFDFNVLSNYSASLFVDLKPYISSGKLPNYTKWYKKQELANWIQIDGKIPGFIQIGSGNYPTSDEKEGINGILPVIRKDILDSNNLAVPKTYDQWFNVMKTLKAKYPDSTPISGRSKVTLIKYLEESLGVYHGFYYDYATKQYKLGIMDPAYRDVLAFEIKCYNEGILDRNFENCTSSTWEEGVAKGKIFFWIDNNSFAGIQTASLIKSNPKAKMVEMPLMTGLTGKKNGFAFADSWYQTTYCLSAKSDKKDQLITFMDWCYSDVAMYINNYGKENVTYTVNKDGSVAVPASLARRYKSKTYPYYAYASDFGLGQLSFTPLVNSNYDFYDYIYEDMEEGETAYDIYKADIKAGNIHEYIQINPCVSADVRESVSEKATAINRLIDNAIYDFITGRKSVSELDSIISQAKSIGADQVLKAYNKAVS